VSAEESLKAPRTKRRGVLEDVSMSKVMHQMSMKIERADVAKGEALRGCASDETCGPTHDPESTGSGLFSKSWQERTCKRR